jgi:uncharacterized OB-fold protein
MSESSWIPEPSEKSKPYFEGVNEGKLRLQVCAECLTWHYPVVRLCSSCGSRSIEWRDTKGKGIVYSHGRLRRAFHPRHEGRLPIVIAQIDIEEGLRLYSNLIGVSPTSVKVGDPVELAFETLPDGAKLPVFKPSH